MITMDLVKSTFLRIGEDVGTWHLQSSRKLAQQRWPCLEHREVGMLSGVGVNLNVT